MKEMINGASVTWQGFTVERREVCVMKGEELKTKKGELTKSERVLEGGLEEGHQALRTKMERRDR